jgi:transmembrane sensor
MKANDSLDPETALEELAAGWIVEREEGFAPERAQEFTAWCDRDPRHADAVARVQNTLALLNEMPAVRASLEARIGDAMERGPAKESFVSVGHFKPWPWVAGLAAALVLGAPGWWLVSTRVTAIQTYATGTNAARRVVLADGSVVDLNANSRFQAKFLAAERQVTLVDGEAHFQVAHDPAHPFVVTANGVSIRAVGTAFNVRLVGDKVDVLVTEGKVVIEQQTRSVITSRAAPIVPLLSAGERTQITPGEESAPPVEEVAQAAVHRLLSWQDRMTSFTDVPLHEMVARINRCNTTQLVLGDSELGNRKIGGVIDLHKVGAFVQLLEQDGDIIAERRPNDEIVLRRAR